jgi:DNA-binding NtrC family response regulator
MDQGNILLISDGSKTFPTLGRLLTSAGYQVTTTCETREAFQRLRRGDFPLVITCLGNGWKGARSLVKAVRELNREIVVLILRQPPEVGSPASAHLIKDTGYDFKPFGWPGLCRLVAHCLSG